jgi:hypothetical protein
MASRGGLETLIGLVSCQFTALDGPFQFLTR